MGAKYKIYASNTQYPNEPLEPNPAIKIEALGKEHKSFTQEDIVALSLLAEKYAVKFCVEEGCFGSAKVHYQTSYIIDNKNIVFFYLCGLS